MSEIDKAAEAMTAWWDDTTWLPFVEAENCNITGPGHQDKFAFSIAVNRWEKSCGGEGEWGFDDIDHLWVVPDEDWESWRRVPEGTPSAIPVTCIWGQR